MDYISQDPRILKIIDNLKTISSTDTNVLLTGESGTGKSLLAKQIFHESETNNTKFVVVNCAAIPENLMESELFGYKKGAFTDAKEDRIGLVEAANNGTLLLDEIGDMSLAMQAKLLDLIQEKKFRRLGDTVLREANIRIIAATNKDLLEMIQEKHFREDLYYRISTIAFSVPPLRERKGDIPLLITNFTERFAKKHNKDIEGIDKNTLNTFLEYNWPGNIRELENTIERIVLLEKRSIISSHNLPVHLKSMSTNIYFQDRLTNSFFSHFTFDEYAEDIPTLGEIESEYIKKIYDVFRNNKVKTAKALGIDRTTLYKKLRDLSLD